VTARGVVPSAIVQGSPAAERPITERIADQATRIHINTGAVCNNNCIFCMEEDREGRYEQNSAITADDVRAILDGNRGAEEVCFTSGEPTTNPLLPDYVKWAHERGYGRISIMTNGRMLSQLPYAQRLVAHGMNRFYVSIHGHDAKLHEGLTRTPGSFAQTVRGIDVVKALARATRRPLELHTSTVITRRNLPHLAEIYRFLRAHGVDQVVFNVMQANGRAHTHFEQIFPRYTDIAAAFRAFVDGAEETARGERVMAFLVDIPLCTTEGIPDFNRGYVEAHTHYGSLAEASELLGALIPEERLAAGGRLVELTRADLDVARRQWRAECDACRYRGVCEGVWGNYLARNGWEEFRPVAAAPGERPAR
jgi:cyclic pyranopterin phosphate synthase